jgi:hypothetical protein
MLKIKGSSPEGLKHVNEEYNHNYIVQKEEADAYKTKKEYHKLYGSLH